MSQADSFVELSDVSVARGSTVVLHDISLQIRPGECVALLGPNGCGKSTLIKVLTSEIYPLARPGMRALFFGRDRWEVRALRARMGLVSSDPPVRDALGCAGLEIVMSGFFSAARLWPHLQPTERMWEQAREALQALGVESLAERRLEAMSAGQQKRIMIARALVGSSERPEKRVLLLDEPANALDLKAAGELRQRLGELAAAGTSIILVTHHVEDIVPGIGRVLLMQEGRIIGDGPKHELLTSERLSRVFDAPITVTQTEGWYTARS